MNDHDSKISELRNKVEYCTQVDHVESRKGKGVVKGEKNEFYHVNTYNCFYITIYLYAIFNINNRIIGCDKKFIS